MFGMVLLGLVCAVVAFPTLVLAALVWLLVRQSRAGQVGMLLLGFVGLGFVVWQWVALQTVAGAVMGAVSDLPYQPNGWGLLWGQLVRLWGLTVPVAPLLGVLFALSRSEGDAVVSKATSRPLPEQAEGHAVLGQALGGDLAACRVGRNAVYPNALLARHAIVVGGSGSGKTEGYLRLGYLGAKVYKRQIFYLDAKGDRETAARFGALMEQAGIEYQVDRVRVGGGVPGGHDPQSVVDPDRIELGLGQLHPILLGDFFDGPCRHRGQTGRNARSCKQRAGVGIGLEQGHDTGTVPARRDDRTRFAELWLFVRRSGVGILYAGRERPDIEKGIAYRFGM